jgi:hypothetical protein
MLERH